ncbi:MAG: hypothetical protein JWR32_6116 [Mycobacterium sp.]|jgi:two-component SAPR family response regulator|nr:hypothetical protein [Mycobacterium sp.]
MSPRFSIALLGGFSARRDGNLFELPPGCQRVVALLALARRPVDREWVCERLWQGVPRGCATARLRSTLWRLRCYGAEHVLVTDPRTLAIAPGVCVDWWRAGDLSAQVFSDWAWTAPPDPVLVAELVPLLQAGELLDGWSDGWAVRDRSRYQVVRSLALDWLARWSPDLANHNDASELVGCADTVREAAPKMSPAVSYSAQSAVKPTPSMCPV